MYSTDDFTLCNQLTSYSPAVGLLAGLTSIGFFMHSVATANQVMPFMCSPQCSALKYIILAFLCSSHKHGELFLIQYSEQYSWLERAIQRTDICCCHCCCYCCYICCNCCCCYLQAVFVVINITHYTHIPFIVRASFYRLYRSDLTGWLHLCISMTSIVRPSPILERYYNNYSVQI